MQEHQAITAYFAAKNRKDVDGMLAAFAADAVVRDEGATHKGHAAIRAGMAETTRRYGVTVEPITSAQENGATIVVATVSGDFPGSPARLTYRFGLENGAISALEIG